MRQHAGCEHGAQVVECQQLSQHRGVCVCVQRQVMSGGKGQGAGEKTGRAMGVYGGVVGMVWVW